MYNCPFCDRKYEKMYILKAHISKFHDIKDIKCPYCSRISKDLDTLRMHALNKSDRLHQKLYFLITKRIIKREDKEFLFSGD